jgi:serine/threonine-protein kinase HipA
MILDVLLHDEHVGRLSERDDRVVVFVLDDAYAAASNRPVLGQYFEDYPTMRTFRGAPPPGTLPVFFANLLPEGALRTLIDAHNAGRSDLATLAFVGEDLPGAVTVRPATNVPADARAPEEPAFDEPAVGPSTPADNDAWRFSLAGMQLKFSALREPHERFTVPFRGRGGGWILKFGSDRYPGLPENEFCTTAWAARCGLDVPRHELVAATDIGGLDPRFLPLGDHVFAVERYDRSADHARVHQEDFAQVRGVPPIPSENKYQGPPYERLARFVHDVCGRDDCVEFLRRVLFLILSGNTDAHLKNWSLIYPDRRAARLAPVYDFVAVECYHRRTASRLDSPRRRIRTASAGSRSVASSAICTSTA